MILGLRPKAPKTEKVRAPKKPKRERKPAAVDAGPVLAPLTPGQYEISPELVVVGAAQSPAAQAIIEAATVLVSRHLEEGRRGLALCGASIGVGVSFVTANLAAALAEQGVSTIVIDCNLRRPGLDRILRPASPVPGLQQFLAHDGLAIDEIVHDEVLPNLSVIYAGGAGADPQSLLAGDRLRGLLRDCLRNYDCTLVDTSAANQGADAMIVAAVLGYAVVVARRGASYADDVELLSSQLVTDGAEVIGSILNVS